MGSAEVDDRILRLAGGHLIVDPGVGFFHAGAQRNGGLPAERFADEGVLGVASVDALGGGQVVVPPQLDAGDGFDEVDQLVDGDLFLAAEVDGEGDILAPHDGSRRYT